MKYIATLALLILPSLVRGQTDSTGGSPWLDGPSNAGTEFFLSFPANWEYAAGSKYVRLYISSYVETEVRITAANGNYNKTVRTIPHDIVTVDLANYVAQPFVRNDQAPVPEDQVYGNAAVHIESDAPIVVSGINRTTVTSDGLLALPVNSLGRRYIVASARSVAGGGQELPSQYVVVAPYDNTTVTIVNSFTTKSHEEGEQVTVTLDRGDVYSANSVGFYGDLSGTLIIADKPVAVIGGQNCTYLPNENYPACDHIVEMMTPMESWGQFYHSLPFQDRLKGDTYRIFAGEANAKIFINGELYATLPGVGGADGHGWLEYRQEERRALEFSSDKPISVMQYNNSQTYDNSTATDPFFMVLTPVEQYQTDLVFTTPSDDFPTNYLAVISDSAGLEQLEIAEAGSDDWQRFRTFPGTGGYRTVPTPIDGKSWAGLVLDVEPGVWRLRGSGGFAAYIYGGGPFESYGYPAGITSFQVNSSDTASPVVSFQVDSCTGEVTGSIRDGGTPGGTSGISTIRMASGGTGYSLEVVDFAPGLDSTVFFSLIPRDSIASAEATLVIYDMAGNRTVQKIAWSGSSLRPLADTVDFGTINRGEQRQNQAVIRNDGDSPIIITSLLLQSVDSLMEGFTLNAGNVTFPLVLQPGESITLLVDFGGDTPGDYGGVIVLPDGCGNLIEIQVRGTIDDETDVREQTAPPSDLDLAGRGR